MIYGGVRLIIGVVIFILCFMLMKKCKRIKTWKNRFLITFLTAMILSVIVALIPFENAFVTFSSPETAFNYANSMEIEAIIKGSDSAMVVAAEKNRYSYLIVPKSDRGWKLGMAMNSNRCGRFFDGNLIVELYRYKNTDDYYAIISNVNGDELSLSDSYNDKFYYTDQYSEALNKKFYVYYVYIYQAKNSYLLTVDDEILNININ